MSSARRSAKRSETFPGTVPSRTQSEIQAIRKTAEGLFDDASSTIASGASSVISSRNPSKTPSSALPSSSRSRSSALNKGVPKFFADEDDESPTKISFRNGILGEHYQVSGTLVEVSSRVTVDQSDSESDADAAPHWISKSDKDEYCVYDFGEKTVITEVNIKFLGAEGVNPNEVRVSMSDAVHLKELKTKPWTIVKRSFVPETATKLHVGWRCDDAARFWKISFPENWGASNTIVQEIQFIAEDTGTRKPCNGLKELSHEHSQQLGRLCTIFDEEACLSDTQKQVRALARKHNIALGDAENLRIKFEKYDEDNSGLICKEEFSKILGEIIRVRKASDIPQERFNHYWREVDHDQSGQIDFEEFLIWYTSVVKTGALNPQSFYATMGSERLQKLNQRMGA